MKHQKLAAIAVALAAVAAGPAVSAQQAGATGDNRTSAAAQAGAPPRTGAEAPATPNVFEGAASAAKPNTDVIRQVQQALKGRGAYDGPVDGVMSPDLQAALRQFQQKQGISGAELNDETLAALQVDPRSGGASGAATPGSEAQGRTQQGEPKEGEAKRMPASPSSSEPSGALTPGLGGGNASRMTQDMRTADPKKER